MSTRWLRMLRSAIPGSRRFELGENFAELDGLATRLDGLDTTDEGHDDSIAALEATDARIVGKSQALTAASNGTITLVAADDSGDRTVLILAHVTTTFADNTGGQPEFEIGQTGTTDKFAAASEFTDATAGTKVVYHGTLTDNTALLVTAVAGTGDGAGAMTVTAIVVPAA